MTKKPLVNFFFRQSGQRQLLIYSEMVVLKAGSLLFWPDSTETFMADLQFGGKVIQQASCSGENRFYMR